jgi:hypothetical protein
LLLENLTKNLPGAPSFERFILLDKNPLGRTTQFRICERPNESMRILHKRLIHYLRSLKIDLPFATGAKPGDSPLKNVMLHRHNRYFYLTDIRNAYLNVNGKRLASILCEVDRRLVGQEEEVFNFLQKYCLSSQGGLIIGAPASPDLFNLYAGNLIDRPLASLSKRYSLTYTRYLDDLTFSSSKVPIGKRKRKAIRTIIETAGFKISHRKSQVLDLKKGTIEINGVGLEWGGRIFLPRDYTRKISGLLHLALRGRNINPNKIHGMMGVFLALTDRRNLNETERKIIKKYQAYRRLIK